MEVLERSRDSFVCMLWEVIRGEDGALVREPVELNA
jgi:hypothetical protein